MKYRTIVADPPWDYPGGVSAGGTPGKPVKSYKLPYSGMNLDNPVSRAVDRRRKNDRLIVEAIDG